MLSNFIRNAEIFELIKRKEGILNECLYCK